MKYYKLIRKLKIYLLVISLLFFIFCIHKIFFSRDININNTSNKIFVHYIDVGQGDSILVQVNNKNLLIDSGPKTNKQNLFNYLNSLKIQKFDYIIATHPHDDHIGNMADVIKSFNIEKFYAPKVTTNTKCFEKMISALKSKNLKINIINEDTSSIDLGDNTSVSVLSPSKDYYDNLNNYSAVVKIKYKNVSFLFLGDAEKEIESDLIKNEDLSSDVIKIGHHGSSTSSTPVFIKKVNPSIAVISVGLNNDYNHPSTETLKTLSDNDIKVYRTDKDKNILISSDGYYIRKE